MKKTEPIPPEFLVAIRNARVYVGDAPALDGVSWTHRDGENWAVLGNNGAGKTTFMRLVFGELLPIYGGEVRWFGERELRPLAEVRERIGYVSAEYQANYDRNITGEEVVMSGFYSSIGLYEKPAPKQAATARERMHLLGIEHLAEKRFRRMSYGEARRVLLARALVNKPDLLILDEPCTGLDIPSREQFLETVEKLAATAATRLIFVTHHIEEIPTCITHVLFLKAGKVFRQGLKAEVLRNEVLSAAFDCRMKITRDGGRYWLAGCGRG